jgi:hypothetical protein
MTSNLPAPQLILYVRDLIFSRSLGAEARQMQLPFVVVRSLEQLLLGVTAETRMLVLDLAAARTELAAIAELQAKFSNLRITGYFPHVDKELQAQAENAGIVTVHRSKIINFLKTQAI